MQRLKKNFKDELQTLLSEVQKEFIQEVKVSVVEYVLHHDDSAPLKGLDARPRLNSVERTRQAIADKKRKETMGRTRVYIRKNLHTVNHCILLVLDIWHKCFSELRLVDLKQLSSLEKAIELKSFMDLIGQQIVTAVLYLKNNWFPALETGCRKRMLPPATAEKQRKDFFECVATIMTTQMQQLCILSIRDFTNFICDTKSRRNKGFVLEVAYRSKVIAFDPSFPTFKLEILNLIDKFKDAVSRIPRIETVLVEKLGLQPLPQEKRLLKPAIPNKILREAKETLIANLDEQRILPEMRIQDFDCYISLINGEWQEEVDRFLRSKQSYDELVSRVTELHELSQTIPCDTWLVVDAGLFEVHRGPLVVALVQAAIALRDQLLAHMRADHLALSSKLSEEYEEIATRALAPPANTAELMTLKEYVHQVESSTLAQLEDRLRQVCQSMLFLVDHMTVAPSEVKQNAAPFKWYGKMPDVLAEHEEIVHKKTAEYQQALKVRTQNFVESLAQQERLVAEFQTLGDINELPRYLQRARTLQSRLNAAMTDIKQFNAEEAAFGWETSQYPLREQISEQLGPYLELYETANGFITKHELWMSSQVGAFHPVEIEAEAEHFWQTVQQLEKTFTDVPVVKQLISKVHHCIEEFRDNLPVIQTLGNPDMKERHWEKVSEIVGFPLKADTSLTLARIIDFGLGDYNSKFQVISESATKENNLEKALNTMIEEWVTMEFSVVPYRESGTYFLSSIDDIQLLLDDHIVKTQTMRGSPYIKPFEKDITEWETNLMLLQEILDSWMKVQGTWMYLEPIFSSPDINAQMPEEGRRFGAVDKMWRDIMKVVVTDLHVLVVSKIDKMLERLHKSSDLLDAIQRGLNDYLDKKRIFFPRFFFLSNDELLEILSETKDPSRVQPNLKKCFRGIARLSFTEDMAISSIISAQGEDVELVEVIDTASARGQVEQWMQQLEVGMKSSVKKIILDCQRDVDFKGDNKWLLESAGQAVLTLFHIKWTQDTEKAIEEGTLNELLNVFAKHIEEETELLNQNISSSNRSMLGVLLSQNIYCRNVIMTLINNGVQKVEDFHWITQLRYYCEEKEILIKMLNASTSYGYEYLGDVVRLVLTSQTIQCYQAIFAALKLSLGVVIDGPVSSGKTESIKDLANIVAKQCVFVSCSSEMDCTTLVKLFKGVASSGAWICLDELDSLGVKTLSSMSHQILAIQRAVKAKKGFVILDNVKVQLDSSSLILATLGNAGSAKLPANLRSLLRPVAMKIPSIRILSEVVLVANGFREAKTLANKIVQVFSHCARKLSLQTHYDHGLRAVKSVLDCAIAQRFLRKDAPEEEIILDAIESVNSSKYTSYDLIVFQEILARTFSINECGLEAKQARQQLMECVRKVCSSKNLQPTESFVESIAKMCSALRVKQGVIVLGQPLAGKTTAYQVLAAALNELENKKVQMTVINPKSLTLEQLYGAFDPMTHEWTDGVLPKCYRQMALSNSQNRKWLIFDGPIDSSWAESLNTVLDDSRRLFLMSGENCFLPSGMNLMFETDELTNVSPAFVSRCGISYISTEAVGWRSLLKSWIQNLPGVLKDHLQIITDLFERFCPPLINMHRKGIFKSEFPLMECNLLRSTTNIYDCFVTQYTIDDGKDEISSIDMRAQLEGIFFYACIWSIGGALDAASRVKFNKIFRGLMANEFPSELKSEFQITDEIAPPVKPYIFPIPDNFTVYNYRFFKEGKGKWRPWEEDLKGSPPIPREIPVNQIIVPTLETVRCSALLNQLVSHNKPLILVGPSGVGKSIYMSDFLENKVDKNVYKPLLILFSNRTSAQDIQDLVMSNVDKRRKGVYGPPLGKKCLVFVDDVNLSEVVNKCQPPVELLRQLLDHETWFEISTGSPQKITDLQILCAMGSAPFGLLKTSKRFLRHFSAISINEFEETTLVAIFSRLMLWHLDTRGFSKEFDPSIDELVAATLKVYATTKSFLMPTPSKCHYIFNLRDFSRVIQGVLLSVPEAIEDLAAMKRLWVHEVLRVFADRMPDIEDRDWLLQVVRETCSEKLGNDMDQMFKHLATKENPRITELELRQLLFCDFANPKADARNYSEVHEIDNLRSVVERCLGEYNSMSKKPGELVMFRYAMEHLSRICRLLKQPRSHGLLVGPVGLGKQSLARLAASICYYELYQPDINKNYSTTKWREDIKELLIRSGTSDQNVVLLFSDEQEKSEIYLEDVNHLLCAGEIANLITPDEKAEIVEKMGEIDKQRDKSVQTDGSNPALLNFFLQKLRDQLHIIICLNPDSKNFKRRLQKFPALINNCTINWFLDWPDDALQDVAENVLNYCGLEGNELQTCIDLCKCFHADAQALSKKAKNHFFSLITPTTYIDFLKIFKKILIDKRRYVMEAQEKCNTAADKILGAEKEVPEMQEEIQNLMPKLRKSAELVEQGSVAVENETRDVTETEQKVLVERELVQEKRERVKVLQEECESCVCEMLAPLDEATANLENLSLSDLSALRGMKSPPKNLKLLMEAICLMKDAKSEKVANPNAPGKTMDDYWGPGKKLLADPKFVEGLMQIDKENIPSKASKQIQERVISDDTFDPDKLKAVAPVTEVLCRWVIALYNYDVAVKTAAPKRQLLAEATEELQNASTVLEEKETALREAESKLTDAKADLVQAQAQREELHSRLELCQKKIKRSEELLAALLGETGKWQARAKELAQSFQSITVKGDMLVCAASVAYLGPFGPNLRSQQTTKWVQAVNAKGLVCSAQPEHFNLSTVLGDKVELLDWNNIGLPLSDSFVMGSAVIIKHSEKWPLIIDPEGQANKWIRAIEGQNQLQVLRLCDSDYIRNLDSCIQNGKAVLLENISGELDPILDPLLMKQTFKQGTMVAVKIGDSVIEYNPNFRLYITTRKRSFKMSPEFASKVTLINLALTPLGLQEQLLSVTVQRERPDLESEKSQIMTTGADNLRQLRELDLKILDEIWASSGDILEDDMAVQAVCLAKTLINEVIEKKVNNDQTEVSIDKSRLLYEPVAENASNLYFSLVQLAALEPMYKFSLAWYTDLFINVIDTTERVEDLQKRMQDLGTQLSLTLYQSVMPCVFEKDKIIFAVLIAKATKKINLDEEEWEFLLENEFQRDESNESCFEWLSLSCWQRLNALFQLSGYEHLRDNLKENENQWKEFYETKTKSLDMCPVKVEEFKVLLILKCIRPDMLVETATNLIQEILGADYVNPPLFNLPSSFSASSCKNALIFMHQPGSDPTSTLLKFATDMRVTQKMQIISLGENQGQAAALVIEEAVKLGSWVLLQNCHYEPDWMIHLEKICDGLGAESTHPEFRLWLSSVSTDHFPEALLQTGIKIVFDPPISVKNNMLMTFTSDPISDLDFYESCGKLSSEFRKLLYSFCFFHALTMQRTMFRPLGWTEPYKFTESDLRSSLVQLQSILINSTELSLHFVYYVASECYYGGLMFDPWDQRCLENLLAECCRPSVENCNFFCDKLELFKYPVNFQYDEQVNHIKKLPNRNEPELCGISNSVGKKTDESLAIKFISDLHLSQEEFIFKVIAKVSASKYEQELVENAKGIISALPSKFDLGEATDTVAGPLKAVLMQDLIQYNELLNVMWCSLEHFVKAMQGKEKMHSELEELAASLTANRIPECWKPKCYACIKSLKAFISDLNKRVQFFRNWLQSGQLNVFWLPGFFAPNSFLSILLENCSPETFDGLDAEKVIIECEILRDDILIDKGVVVSGLYLNGASWDAENNCLAEIVKNGPYSEFPKIWLKSFLPSNHHDGKKYTCPVYQTSERRGVINSSGLSSNFLFSVQLNTNTDPKHWILRGVALLCQLPD
ncbi:dynein axonemal heavy chain 7-like [Cloeon dipterum]|uniref:dynein axonemal heavy chain 7-like n=1 Tax=Cloeon dipterum TaxID=197152 RepID=UPI00321FEDB1